MRSEAEGQALAMAALALAAVERVAAVAAVGAHEVARVRAVAIRVAATELGSWEREELKSEATEASIAQELLLLQAASRAQRLGSMAAIASTRLAAAYRDRRRPA